MCARIKGVSEGFGASLAMISGHYEGRKPICPIWTTLDACAMSIRNFPENPKIILRKSADQAKGAKNKKYEVAILICAGSLYFYVALPLTLTNNSSKDSNEVPKTDQI